MSSAAEVPTDPLGAFVIGPRPLQPGAPNGTLAGARFAVKDLFDVAGTKTGAGNPDWLADAVVASEHAPAVTALLAAGADLWGKTVTDELAFSLSGTNVHYGTPVNVGAPGRVPGGSSSGSAAAVAGGAVELALGTDTGGSTRVPASYCGIYGLRTSHGRIDMGGVVPLAPSFDTVGLFAADPTRLATAWRALAAEASTAGASTRECRGPGATRTIRRLVMASDLMDLAGDHAATALRAAAASLGERLGLPVVERSLADPGQLEVWRDAFRALQQVEIWRSDGEWITAREPTFGPGVAVRFADARATDPAEAERARPVRSVVARALSDMIGDDGLLVKPAASGSAPFPAADSAAKADQRARTQLLTAPAGMAGAPELSLPLATLDSLPVGLALLGHPGDDDLLVSLADREGSGPG